MFLDYLNLTLLSVLQGITEFLPISSSGHLIILASLLPGRSPNLLLDSILHLGTLMAIIIYFQNHLKQIITNRKIIISLIICAVPAGILGITIKDYIEDIFRNPLTVGISLVLSSSFLFWADRKKQITDTDKTTLQNLEKINPLQSFKIGLMQSLALIPGTSRSGATISGGILCGLDKKTAIEYSFLASIPVIGGASLLEIISQIKESSDIISWELPLGFFIAFISGYISLKWLIKIMQNKKFRPFVIYRVILGSLIILWSLFS